jgi:hypothetical protein
MSSCNLLSGIRVVNHTTLDPDLPYLSSVGLGVSVNQELSPINIYGTISGTLSGFDSTNGIFTAPKSGFYLITANAQYEHSLTFPVSDGVREISISSVTGSTAEPLRTQTVFVDPPTSPTGPFYSDFKVLASVASCLFLNAGSQIAISSYQVNSNTESIVCHVLLSIVLIDKNDAR